MSKPHLRLHYAPRNAESSTFVWSVELVRDDRTKPSQRARNVTLMHDTARGACRSALVLWWPQWAQRAYG